MAIGRTGKISTPFMVYFSPLLIFFSLLAVLLFETAAFAETYYVKPSAEVVVRRGQGNEYKIIAMVKDGTSIQLLEEGEYYAKVHLADGKEGWMLKRFLSNEPPLKGVVASLRGEKEALVESETAARAKLEDVSAMLSRTEAELASVVTERDQVRSAYQALLEDTENVVQIKNELLKTVKENESYVEELTVLKQERKNLKQDHTIKWFLVGGGVLLAGMLMGMIFSGSRRRKPSLM